MVRTGPTPAVPGQVLGGYRLEELVAQGGMGEIWRGREVASDRPVAVKRLRPPGPCPDPTGAASRMDLAARLVREAQVLARLRHDHIVTYLASGTEESGHPYLVLEWLHGEDLAVRQGRAPLSIGQAVRLVQQALGALAACHPLGIIHRDIKPANLFLVEQDGQVRLKLMDFGLARLLQADATLLTQTGQVVGTLFYLSPEQARGVRELDPRTDLYSLGVVLYEVCTGRLPFHSDTPLAVLLKIVSETPPPPCHLRPDLPEALEAVILRAMQKEPGARFGSAEQMSRALAAVGLEGESYEVTLPLPTSNAGALSYSAESRLVSLLCVQPRHGGGLGVEVAEVVLAQGGVVYSLLGGCLFGIFGMERSTGDEALRAVRAGLAISASTLREAQALVATVRLEIQRSRQLDAGELDRVAVALAGLPMGSLCIDRSSQELVREQVVTHRQGEHEVVVQLVSDPGARCRRVLGRQTPTVGRESELSALRSAFHRVARERTPGAALVIGEAGTGKSRLCQDLGAELRRDEVRLVEGRATSRSPYRLLGECVAAQAGLQAGASPAAQRDQLTSFLVPLLREPGRHEVLTFLAEVTRLPPVGESPSLRLARDEPRLMHEKVALAFERLVEGAGRQGPVCLVLEDLHAADEESLLLADRLLERLDSTPLFILGTTRPDLPHPGRQLWKSVDLTQIELQPLGRRSVRRLLESILGQAASRPLIELVESWCAGNPYRIEELAAWLASQQVVRQGPAGWELVEGSVPELPPSVQAATQARLDQLAPALKRLLKTAAVFGEVFWEAGCSALRAADAGEALGQLAGLDLVFCQPQSRIAGTTEWCFRHALLQQVAYRMLTSRQRQALHLKAARWLDGHGWLDAGLIGQHYERGGDPQSASRCYAAAGERAMADGNLDRAIEFFQSAVIETGTLLSGAGPNPAAAAVSEEHTRQLLGLARCFIQLSHYDQAAEILDRLESLGLRAEVVYQRARVDLGRGDWPAGETRLARVLDLLVERPDGDLDFSARNTLFWTLWSQGKYSQASPVAELLYLAARKDDRPDHLCAAKLAFAYWNMKGGDLGLAVTLAGESVEHARACGDPFREVDGLTLLGWVQVLAGLYPGARVALERALTLAARLRTTYQQANAACCLAELCMQQGEQAEALTHFQLAREKAEAIASTRSLVTALAGSARALIQLDAGARAQASEWAQRALELATGQAMAVADEAALALAQIALAGGDAEAALKHALAAVRFLEVSGAHGHAVEILMLAHEAAGSAGRREEATGFVEQAVKTIRERSDRIKDPALRQSFCQQVPAHRRAMERERELRGGG